MHHDISRLRYKFHKSRNCRVFSKLENQTMSLGTKFYDNLEKLCCSWCQWDYWILEVFLPSLAIIKSKTKRWNSFYETFIRNTGLLAAFSVVILWVDWCAEKLLSKSSRALSVYRIRFFQASLITMNKMICLVLRTFS